MWWRVVFGVFVAMFMVAAAVGYTAYRYVDDVVRDLPSVEELARYNPPTSTRVFAADQTLIAEFAAERRIYTPISAIPPRVINAFLAAEDRNFFEHQGVDITGVARAMATNVKNVLEGRRLVGASTITQQVAKNLLLTNEVSINRKIREAFLARQIEANFSKDEILELYLNAIFLGERSYGVAAAAESYFNKSLSDLTLAEAAYLAALPKAPMNYHPVRHKDRAIARRNWVLERMLTNGTASAADVSAAQISPLRAKLRRDQEIIDRSADDFVEEVRRELLVRFGEKAVYQDGLIVHVTMDPRQQRAAVNALRQGLEQYDRGTGYRGTGLQIAFSGLDWVPVLRFKAPPVPNERWRVGVVVKATTPVEIGFMDGLTEVLDARSVDWARKGRGLKRGDVVFVEQVDGALLLRQAPGVNGALVSVDAADGRVRALVGGYSFVTSSFNRATQAKRQPGSAFKPFVYAAALNAGYTPNTVIYDTPIAIAGTGPSGDEVWSPNNFDMKFMGPVSMRTGLELSRNAMTVRLARKIGMPEVAKLAQDFGISDRVAPVLANSLGAAETTPLRLATAYAILANGGLRLKPVLIDRVLSREGKVIYRSDARDCPLCDAPWLGQEPPAIVDDRSRVLDAITTFQVTQMLKGVVERGTATSLRALGRPLAGKTGTTNDHKDAWFVGYTPDVAAAVYVGYDQPRPLGKGITGGEMSAPIFLNFARTAWNIWPKRDFPAPESSDLVRVWVHPRSGQPTAEGIGVYEAFRMGTEPGTQAQLIVGPEAGDPGYTGADGVIQLTPAEDGSVPIAADAPPQPSVTEPAGEDALEVVP